MVTEDNESSEIIINNDVIVHSDQTSNVNGNSETVTVENTLDNDEIQIARTRKRTRKRTRWTISCPESWSVNVEKGKRKKCLPYKSRKGIERPAKQPKVACNNSCRFKCSQVFIEEERIEICRTFWSLDYDRQKDFYIGNIEQNLPIRKKLQTTKGNRQLSRSYFFKKGDKKVRICQTFFKNTLSISDGPIIHAFKTRSNMGVFEGPDKRGKHSPSNKTSADSLNFVKSHIEKFPVMESHYCRRSSKRLYLDSKHSIAKMYELYLTECASQNKSPVSSNEAKLTLSTEYQLYRKRIEDARLAKATDKERSNIDPSFLSATFDLQSVLQILSSDTSQLYHSRKICVYNLTIYESRLPNDGYCNVWTEMNGKRGSSEIGSALWFWLKQIPKTVKELSLFSDCCGGQNRNQHIAAFFMYVVQTLHFDCIEHKFLETGHTHMEVESMHSAIEAQKKIVPIFSIIDWMTVFRLARSSRKRKNAKPFNVHQLTFSDMLDLSDLSKKIIKNRNKDENGATVKWLKIKCLKYEKSKPNCFQYRYDFTMPYINVFTKGRGR